MRNLFNQTSIENSIVAIVREANVCENVFTNRPRSSTKKLDEFIVCRISGGITDRCALGECTVNFSLFAQDISNIKNSAKLSIMQTRLLNGLPYESGRVVFKPFSVNLIGDVPSDGGYHARVITIQAFIKITE